MSYRKKHIKSKIYRIKGKKPLFKRPWIWYVIFSFILILILLYFWFFYSGLQVNNVLISGNKDVKTDELQNIVFQRSNIKLMSFAGLSVATKSIFVTDKKNLENIILQNFSAVESVNINRKLPQTLVVTVTERTPVGVFCAETTKDNCFLIDKNGVIFGQKLTPSDTSIIVRLTSGGNNFSEGKKVIDENEIKALTKVQDNLESNFQINLTEAIIYNSKKITVTTDKNWEIIFDPSPASDSSSGIDSQLLRLNMLLREGIPAENIKNLKYIDLRLKDRAIVCDNQECKE